MSKFVLEIELGNSGMLTRTHVAEKLRQVSKDIIKVLPDSRSALIRDINGNRVGKWEFKKE